MYIFEISIKRQIFLNPVQPIQINKTFHLIEELMCAFDEQKRSKMQATT
jgi:hypothetical protein